MANKPAVTNDIGVPSIPLGNLIRLSCSPIYAIPKALKQAGLSLQDIGLIELNEAFASQSVAIKKELGTSS